MGIFHYYLAVVPANFAAPPLSEIEPWRTQVPPPALIGALKALLPIDKSWGSVSEYAAAGDFGSDFRVWRSEETDAIEALEFRFSPFSDPLMLMDQFLASIVPYDVALWSPATGRTLPPDIVAVCADMKETSAYRFLSDPEGTIRDAKIERT